MNLEKGYRPAGGLFGTPPATGNFLGVDSVDGTTTILVSGVPQAKPA
jgi:hypothetical protein